MMLLGKEKGLEKCADSLGYTQKRGCAGCRQKCSWVTAAQGGPVPAYSEQGSFGDRYNRASDVPSGSSHVGYPLA